MKLTKLRPIMLTAAIALSGTQVMGAPFDTVVPIISTGWASDPNDYGMTPDEFIRAESLHFMTGMAKREGINKFYHFTSLAKAADKWVVSPNNDVIYSMAIVDASKGFTLTLPETGERFITAQIVTEEHMSHQLVGGGVYEFKGSDFEGTHVAIGVRVGTDASQQDVETIVKDLQPQMKVAAPSADEVANYDEETLIKVRAALMEEYDKLDDTFGLMTDDVHKVTDWERFTYATAGAWGLSADKYAMYLPYNLPRAKKDLCYVATYEQPKVGEFWSITAYNNEKYLMANENNIVNTGNVALNDDQTFTVHFGPESCRNRKDVKNFILVTEDDWGFLMRAYEPDVEAFKAYEIPELTPIYAQVGQGEVPVKPITKENYVVAETDWYFTEQQLRGPVNTFTHNGPVSKDAQNVIRSNRDVMYSLAVVDISKGATFTIPQRDAFQAIHIMDENHLTHRVVRAGESLQIGPNDVTGGSHVYLLARTKITDDMEESLAAQRAMKIEAQSARPYPSKGFDEKNLVAQRNALTKEYVAGKAKILEHKSFVSTLKDADPESYLYAAAVGWGGLPSHTAQYLPAIPGQGTEEAQKITIPKPDLDWDSGGFFSLTTYDADGWIVEDNFYIDHSRMQDNGDSFTIYLNTPDQENSVTVNEGWTGVFRFYLPKDESEFVNYIESLREIQLEKETALIPVDEDNLVQSKSDIYFGQVVDAVGTNKIQHNRATADINSQGIIRENRDTLYSKAVVDARSGFRVTLPASGKTYMAVLILNYNTGLVREAEDRGDVGTYMAYPDKKRVIDITPEAAGTDFVYLFFRTQTDNSPEENAAGAQLQDSIKLEVPGDPQEWKPQNFDTRSRDELADLYKSHLAEYVARGAWFGYQEDSVVEAGGEKAADVRRHYAAFGWGGQLERYATYLTTPVIKGKDGGAVSFTVTPFKVREDINGFWSYTVYDAKGWIATENNIINNDTAVLSPDGTLTLCVGTRQACGTEENRMDLPKGGFSIVTRIYNSVEEIPLSKRGNHIPIP